MDQLRISKNTIRRDSDALDKYLNDISRENLLSPEEEIEVVKRIKAGDEKAKERLIKANLRFVVSVAKHYQNTPSPLCDLINEGNIGLIKAAERFDETRGFKFISYAVWWIRRSILAALNGQSRMIRIPTNKISSVSRLMKVMDRWEQKYERMPTTLELAELMHMDEDDIKQTLSTSHKQYSLSSIQGGDVDRMLQDILPNPIEEENLISSDYVKNELWKLLSRLNEREQQVIKMTFGLGYTSTRTLEEIGNVLGISRERVRQIKARAIKKLSSRTVRDKLKLLLA